MSGSGIPIVCFNGGPGCDDYLEPVAHLIDDRCRVVRFEPRGNASEDIRPNWPTQQLATLIPNARYVEVPGAAHMIWLTHAAELQQELQIALAHIVAAHA